MEVSFVPKSIGNLSRLSTETQSVLCKWHEHCDGPVFHLVRIKGGTKSSLAAPAFKGTDGHKVWNSNQKGLRASPCAHEIEIHFRQAGHSRVD
jgi:hypothetical protein